MERLVIVALVVSVASGFTPLSEITTGHITADGSIQAVHYMRAICDEQDADVTHILPFVDQTTGQVTRVHMICEAPEIIHTRQRAGSTSLCSYPMITGVCATTSVGNNSVLINNAGYDPYLGTGNNFPATPPPDGTQTNENYAARRLLSNMRQIFSHSRVYDLSYDAERKRARPDALNRYDIKWNGKKFMKAVHKVAQFTKDVVTEARQTRRLLGQERPAMQLTSYAATGLSALQTGQDQFVPTKVSYPRYITPKPGVLPTLVSSPHGNGPVKTGGQGSAALTMGIGMGAIAAIGAMSSGPFAPMVAGFAFGELCQHGVIHCGGGSVPPSVATALKMIGVWAHSVTDSITVINQIVQQQGETIANIGTDLFDISEEQRFQQKQTNELAKAVINLNENVNILFNISTDIVNTVNKALKASNDNLENVYDESIAFQNATLQSFRTIEDRVGQLTRITVHIDRLIRQLDITAIQDRRKTFMRRNLVATVFRMMDTDTPLPSKPFLSDLGRRPLTDAQVQARNNLNDGVRLATTRIQRTLQVGANYFAQLYKVDIVCNAPFAATRFIGAPSFMDLMDAFSSTPGCYPGDPDQAWTCHCAALVEYEECQIATIADVYPWTWGNITTLPDQGEDLSKCSANVQLRTIANGGGAVYDTKNDLEVFLQGFCTNTIADAVPSTQGYDLRWFAQNIPRYNDQDVGTTGTDPEVCDPNFSNVRDGDPAIVIRRPAMLFYHWAQTSATVTASKQLVDIEDEYYGRMPSGLTYWNTPFNDQTVNQQTFECQYVGFAKICDEKLPIYRHSRLQTVKGVRFFTEDGQPITNGTLTSPWLWEANAPTTSHPLNGRETNGANLSVTTNVELHDESEHILPDTFFTVGKWLDPANPLITYDVPQDEMVFVGSRVANMGFMSYLIEGEGWPFSTETSPLNFTLWQGAFQTEFDVRGVGAAPDRYKRELIQITPTRYVCGDMFDSDGVTKLNNTGLFEWCRILASYDCRESTNRGQDLLICSPHVYNMDFQLEVPGGMLVTDQHSVCPTTINVTRTSTDIDVVLGSTATEPVQIFVRLSDEAQTLACTIISQQYSMSKTNPIVIDVPTILSCEPMYINFRTLHGGWCLPEPGLEVQNTYSLTPSIGVPPAVSQWTQHVQDQITVSLMQNMIQTVQIVLQLMDANTHEASTSLGATLQRIMNDTEAHMETYKASPAAIAKRQRLVQQFRQNTKNVDQAISRQRQFGNVSMYIEMLENNLEYKIKHQVSVLGALGLSLNNRTGALRVINSFLQDALTRAEDDILDEDSGSFGDCGVPLIGSIVCALEKGLGSILSSSIVRFLLYIGIVILFIWLAKEGCAQCRSRHKQYPPNPQPYPQPAPQAYYPPEQAAEMASSPEDDY